MTDEKKIVPVTDRLPGGAGRLKRGGEAALRGAEILGAVLCGFLFAGTPLIVGTYPLVIAAVAASSANAVFLALGAFISFMFTGSGGEYMIAVACVCALRAAAALLDRDSRRALLRSGTMRESTARRVLIASFACSVLGFTQLLSSEYGIEDLVRALVLIFSGASLALVFSFYAEKGYRYTPFYTAGAGALLFFITLSLSEISVIGIRVSPVLAVICACAVGYFRGEAAGCIAGLVCGVAVSPPCALLAAAAGLSCGFFFGINRALAVLVTAPVTAALNLYLEVGAGYAELAALVAVPAAIAVLSVTGVIPAGQKAGKSTEIEKIINKKIKSENEKRLDMFSKTMRSLAQILSAESGTSRIPCRESLENMCKNVWEDACFDCPCECPCHDIESVKGGSALGNLVEKLMSTGRIDKDKLADVIKARCPKTDEIIRKINLRMGEMLEDAAKYDRDDVFALDYEAAADMFSQALSQSSGGYEADRILTDRLRRAFARAGITVENLLVCGDRKKHIIATGRELLRSKAGSDDIRRICESACRTRFTPPEFVIDNGNIAMVLESRNIFGVCRASACQPKEGECENGDASAAFTNGDGYYYTIICDGMGSGRNAAVTSGICRVFLEKMLACSNRKSTALEMLNSILCHKKHESFATVDMLEIDLMRGDASFLKCGAAPSYVLRDKRLYKISSGTLPIGIMPKTDTEVTEFALKDNDIIVMCSDGVAQDFELSDDNPAWFVDYITECWDDDLDGMARKIIKRASERNPRSDDMTVELMRVSAVCDDGEDGEESENEAEEK